MNKIKISEVKYIREQLGATHLVLFAVDETGTQFVATHGKTRQNAREASTAGNKLKTHLGFPDSMCRDNPLPRICKNCVYWKADYGIHCFNGWSQDGSTGFCRFEPTHTKTSEDNLCGHFEPNC